MTLGGIGHGLRPFETHGRTIDSVNIETLLSKKNPRSYLLPQRCRVRAPGWVCVRVAVTEKIIRGPFIDVD